MGSLCFAECPLLWINTIGCKYASDPNIAPVNPLSPDFVGYFLLGRKLYDRKPLHPYKHSGAVVLCAGTDRER